MSYRNEYGGQPAPKGHADRFEYQNPHGGHSVPSAGKANFVDDEACEQSLLDLAETDEEMGRVAGDLVYRENQVDIVESRLITASSKTSVDARKADARSAPAYEIAVNELARATAAHVALKNRRGTAIYRIEVWRSLQANRRNGVV